MNVDATGIISSHTDIYKGRVANLLWELIALPTPQDPAIKKIELTIGSGSGLQTLYGVQGERNLYEMHEMNRLRQIDLTERNPINELGSVAHRLDDDLRNGDWVAAETDVLKLENIGKAYPGWFVHVGFGLVHEGKLFKSSQVGYEWYPLGSFSLKLLRGFALAQQGRCADAEEAFIDSTKLMFSEVRQITNPWWRYPIAEKLGDHNLVFQNCYFRKTGNENDKHRPMQSQPSETPTISHP